jgi:hypothetical protein
MENFLNTKEMSFLKSRKNHKINKKFKKILKCKLIHFNSLFAVKKLDKK